METPRRSARILKRTKVSLENGRGFSVVEKTVVEHGPYFKAYVYFLESLIPFVSWILSIVIFSVYFIRKYLRYLAIASTIVGLLMVCWNLALGKYFNHGAPSQLANVAHPLDADANGNSIDAYKAHDTENSIFGEESSVGENVSQEYPPLAVSPLSTNDTLIDFLEKKDMDRWDYKFMQLKEKVNNISTRLDSVEKVNERKYQELAVNLSESIVEKVKEMEFMERDGVLDLIKDNCKVESRVNYALKTRGASIIQASDDYRQSFKSKWLRLIFPGAKRGSKNKVESVLESRKSPGDCWAMNGSNGFVSIALSQKIIPDTLVLQHASLNELSGFRSAPKQIQIYSKNALIGSGNFDPTNETTSVFDLRKVSFPIESLSIRVLSNWGNKDYTCIYQIQVFSSV